MESEHSASVSPPLLCMWHREWHLNVWAWRQSNACFHPLRQSSRTFHVSWCWGMTNGDANWISLDLLKWQLAASVAETNAMMRQWPHGLKHRSTIQRRTSQDAWMEWQRWNPVTVGLQSSVNWAEDKSLTCRELSARNAEMTWTKQLSMIQGRHSVRCSLYREWVSTVMLISPQHWRVFLIQ